MSFVFGKYQGSVRQNTTWLIEANKIFCQICPIQWQCVEAEKIIFFRTVQFCEKISWGIVLLLEKIERGCWGKELNEILIHDQSCGGIWKEGEGFSPTAGEEVTIWRRQLSYLREGKHYLTFYITLHRDKTLHLIEGKHFVSHPVPIWDMYPNSDVGLKIHTCLTS